jgi:hypothetical protein
MGPIAKVLDKLEGVQPNGDGQVARCPCPDHGKGRLHAENETRYLSLTVTDTREQTRHVFRALAQEEREQPDRERWHALQSWLETAERRVTIPYAPVLAEKVGDVAVRLRRDFSVSLSLVKAHAILHQVSRRWDKHGRIEATLEDYARVRELVAGLVAEGVEATVPSTIRETVEAVQRLTWDSNEDSKGKWCTTKKAVAKELDIDKAAAWRRVKVAINRGYLENMEEHKGRPAQLVLGEAMPKDSEVLPTVTQIEAELSGCAVDHVCEGNKPPFSCR